MIRLKEKEFDDIVNYMRDTYGINLAKKKVLIECRLTREAERQGVSTFEAYLARVRSDRSGKLADAMVNRLTTNYTYFMREPDHFRILREGVFPEFEQKLRHKDLKIWSAGCATGEECYTVAMSLQDYRDRRKWNPCVKILATDISQEVLDRASQGIYPSREMEALPAEWKRLYCVPVDTKTLKIDDRIRRQIRFFRHNLMTPLPLTEKFDLIMCRNVMIYFDRISKEKLVGLLEKSLNPGGYLMIGHAELLNREETTLSPVYPAVYKKI